MPSSNSRRAAVTGYGALAFATSLAVHAASQTVEALADGLLNSLMDVWSEINLSAHKEMNGTVFVMQLRQNAFGVRGRKYSMSPFETRYSDSIALMARFLV